MDLTCLACAAAFNGKKRMEFVSPFNRRVYRLYRCPECRLEFWSPPELIREFYEAEFMPEYSRIHQDQTELGENVKLFFQLAPGCKGDLLDVGCGNGSFLKEAEKIGFRVAGVDFDTHCVETARKKGLDVYCGTVAEAVESRPDWRAAFDAVTFFEVLEHQEDPAGFVQSVKKLLRPGGYIALSVPNRRRLGNVVLRVLYRIGWSSDQIYRCSTLDLPPHHLVWWSAPVLERFLARMGFTEIKVRTVTLNYQARVQWWRSVFVKAVSNFWRAAEARVPCRALSYLLGTVPFGFGIQL